MTNGKLPKEVRKKAIKLRKKQQELSGLVQQKQSLKGQLTETENALSEVKEAGKDEKLYQITGTVMVSKSKEELIEDLKDKKDVLELRTKRLDKKIKSLRKEIKQERKDLSKQVKGSGISG